MSRAPMIVHCCHCTWCRRESGAAFALNAMVESDAVQLTRGEVDIIDMPTLSGRGKKSARCRRCNIVLWGNFSSAGTKIHFVRLGTVDDPTSLPPDVHIFTSTKLPWVDLGTEVPAFPEFYVKSNIWSADSIARYDKAIAG